MVGILTPRPPGRPMINIFTVMFRHSKHLVGRDCNNTAPSSKQFFTSLERFKCISPLTTYGITDVCRSVLSEVSFARGVFSSVGRMRTRVFTAGFSSSLWPFAVCYPLSLSLFYPLSSQIKAKNKK